jgi:hypothetical protein
MRWIAIGAVLCACNNEGAIEIVVEMDPTIAVDKVQLYIGLGSRDNLDDTVSELLVPGEYKEPAAPSGFYWRRDPNAYMLTVPGGAADVRFVFHEGTHKKLTAIVVGTQNDVTVAATTLVDARIEDSTVRQYHVKLQKASAAFPRQTGTATTVHHWGPTPEAGCTYYQEPDKPGIYLVDHGDIDCDGVLYNRDEPEKSAECRHDIFNYTARAKPETTRFLVDDPIPSLIDGACVLGGPACVDGKGIVDGRFRSAVCAQPLHCGPCATASDPIDCMARTPLSSTGVTRYECTFFVGSDGGTNSLCENPAVLTNKLPFVQSCRTDQPYWLWEADLGTWSALQLKRQPLTFLAEKPTAACDLRIGVTGTLPAMLPVTFRSVITIPLANDRLVALPLALTVTPTNDCSVTPNECHIAGSTSASPDFMTCLTSPAGQPW